MGDGFSSVTKGGGKSVNLELQYGQTFWGRGDATYSQFAKVSAFQEFVAKIQILW